MSKQQPTINRVLVLVDATPKGGTVVLRALNGWEHQIAEQTVTIAAEDFTYNDAKLNGDHTKLIAIIKAMKQLVSKLPAQKKASYHLVIVHSSQNVQGWLTQTAARKADLVQEFGGYVDRLSGWFPQLQFEHRPRKVITDLMQ